MLDNKNIKKSIEDAETIEEVLDYAMKYYANIPIKIRAIIFNRLIFNRKINPDDKYLSIKLATNLSFLFLLYPVKKGSILYKLRNYDINDEIAVFRVFVMKINNLYNEQQIEDVYDESDAYLGTFSNYHFNYPSISTGEYLNMFKLFEEVSYKLYGFSIYRISKILLFFTSDIYTDQFGNRKITNEWISNERMNQYFGRNLPDRIFKKLFLEKSELEKKKIYPTDIPNIFKGRIGIKFDKGYFIPQCAFIFENILRYLIESNESNEIKGEILEQHTKVILSNFFDEDLVISGAYDRNKKEQDILILYKDFVLAIECKAQDFKEVFRDRTKAINRLSNRFNQVILKGCTQCQRAKEYIENNNPAIYYDSDKESREKLLVIDHTQSKHILKVVVTIDDYLNLAESSHNFLKSEHQDTWIVNLFTLKKILWATKNEQDFIDYIVYRSSDIKSISSINSDELDQYGYYKSNSYNLYPPNDIGITVNLMSGFSEIFDKYDNFSLNEELKALDKYLDANMKNM